MTKETTQKCVNAPWTTTCVSKSKRLRTDVYKMFYPIKFFNNEPCYGELLRPFISVLYRSQNGAELARSVSRLSYGLDDPGFEIRQGKRFFSFPKTSRPALGSIQPPVKCVLVSLLLRVNRPGREGYNTYLVSRLRMTGAMPPLPHIPSRRAYEQLSSFRHHFVMEVHSYMG